MISPIVLVIIGGAMLRCQGQKLKASSPIPKIVVPSAKNESNSKRPLVLSALVNYGGAIFPIGPICTVGIQLAVDAIKNGSILDDFEFQVEPLDDLCSRPLGLQMVLGVIQNKGNYVRPNRVPMVAGTTCSQHTYFGMFLQHFNHIGIGGLTIVPEIYLKRSLYAPYFSVAPSMEIYYVAIPYFLRSNGWTKTFLLSEGIGYFNQLEQGLSKHLIELNITLGGVSKIVSASGEVPAPQYIEDSVREIMAFGPRVIILSTNNGAVLACWLHRYKLYGPSYVYLANPGAYFTPNSPARYSWCTEQMLFDVLRSTIFFNFGAPPQAGSTEALKGDSLGLNANLVEGALKEKVEDPDLSSMWLLWKYLCYEEVAASALVLDAVDKDLKKQNDSLANWVTSSSYFQGNGSYIYKLMKSNAEKLRYKGLGSVSESPLNGRTGVTGFLQMQLVKQPSATVSLTAALRPILVAWYDSSDPRAMLMKTGPPYDWRTHDGQPPFDSVRVITVLDPIVPRTTNSALRAIAAVFLLATIALVILTIWKRKTEIVALSMPWLNTLILFGNALVLGFVLVMPADSRNEDAATNCMAASLMVVPGFSLLTGAILAKMHVAQASASKKAQLAPKSAKSRTTRFQATMKSVFSRAPRTQLHFIQNRVAVTPGLTELEMTEKTRKQQQLEQAIAAGKELFHRQSKLAPFVVAAWAIAQTCIMAIWFGLDPIRLAKVTRNLERSQTDLSLVYQHVSYACALNTTSIYPTIFIPILACCYAIVFLRSILLAIVLRSVKLVEEINDLQTVRNSSYTVGLAAIAGGAVIYLFFGGDPGTQETAACILSLLVVLVSTLVIFAAKMSKGYYL